MAQTYTTLPSLFTAIASAIRDKTGTTSKIVADTFPTKIGEVYNAAKVGTAVASQVLTGKTFTNSTSVGITGTMAEASTGTASTGTAVATVTPTTSVKYVNVTSGYTAAKYWKIDKIYTQTTSVTPNTAVQTVTPGSGTYYSTVTINAISTQTKSITATTAVQTASPDSGKYLTSVTVNPQLHSGTYNVVRGYAHVTDMGEKHNYRYVNSRGYYYQFTDATSGGTTKIKFTSPWNGSGHDGCYGYYVVPDNFYVSHITALGWNNRMHATISFAGLRIYTHVDDVALELTIKNTTAKQTTWNSTNYGWYRGTCYGSRLYPKSTAFFTSGDTVNPSFKIIVCGSF